MAENSEFGENENDENAETDASSDALQESIPESMTHLLPPKNLIKLEDRLRYLLQPPLEQLYTDKNLVFPFVPFHYQWEGVSFLYSRDSAILADEMGLGKTMQAITTVRLLLRNGDIRNVLFVCPKPLVTNWKREFEVWAPEIPILVIQGDRVRREWQWGLQDIPVKIANYELLNRDRDIFAPKKGIPKHFDLVVLDESQRIKNIRSATSSAARAISRTRNWAMTGTPIENSPEDLVGIFEFLSPGYLSSDMKPSVMSRAVQDYILRRTKDLVQKDMPPRLYRDAELFMTPEQQETYTMAESQGALRLSEMGDAVTIQHVFELVLRLKQICNFDPCTGESPKLQRLEADLEEIAASGRKAIVFSQWTETIFRLAKHLERFGALQYHGKIPPAKRDAVVQKFKNSPDHHVLLMSYATGAVGLNLQFCNYVFLFDRWWNPAIEDQAINRAHRIGVKGAVTITRFLMINTIEERINRILEEKRALFETILSGSREEPKKLGLTQEAVFGLFKLKSPKGVIHRL
ncbi:MAG: DEAD/DEAH box helicase [Thermoguttaceae bacterium]|nr:DEAD/DEAH box helicase [Thermoguttaceae bacterium]